MDLSDVVVYNLLSRIPNSPSCKPHSLFFFSLFLSFTLRTSSCQCIHSLVLPIIPSIPTLFSTSILKQKLPTFNHFPEKNIYTSKERLPLL
ncbi:hypothetical protein BGW80DRAFT_1279110, partial [Lactifluus volemus]